MEKQHITKKTCILSVFHIFSYQNTKMNGKPPIWENKTTIQERYFFIVYERVIHQKESMERTLYMKIKHYLKRLLSDFEIVTYQNDKNSCKTPFMKNQNNIIKNVYFQCFVSLLRRKCQKADKVPYTRNVYYERFLSFLGTKTQNALFVFYMEEQNNITKNVYLRVFYIV